VAGAKEAYEMAVKKKQHMMEPLESLPMYVQDAEDAKADAEAAHAIAAQHTDTQAQRDAL
jgi:hypothetical protein